MGMTAMAGLDWIGVDWGTSNARAYAMGPNNERLGSQQSSAGMGSLNPADYNGELDKLIRPWTGQRASAIDVIVCGMAGSRQGWQEAPYATVPASVDKLVDDAITISNPPAGYNVQIIPGLCQRTPSLNIMRGEETQLAGLVANDRTFTGIVCQPGTHSKWVAISGGQINRFQTFMTGELFDLLASHSILKHSVTSDDPGDAAGAADASGGFSAGLQRSRSHSGLLTAELFSIRAGTILDDRSVSWSRQYLSGLLIGTEISAALADMGAAVEVHIISSRSLGKLYQQAFDAYGVSYRFHDGDDMVLNGLSAYHDTIKRRRL
jgi:2-dehydro-3-deoxygalactonokinase